jgi:tetratricopeptide (TPR) repeat protein
VAAPVPALAAEPGRDLPGCLRRAETSPEAGFEWALGWEDSGGGEAARLCQAMALYHRGEFQAAATRLEDLAAAPSAGAAAPDLWARAGWAWVRADRAAEAERAYGEAISRRPKDPELRIDRAIARAGAERYWDAIQDLDAALALAPGAAEALVLRAEAHRALGNLAQAQADVARALESKPDDPDALLLRGNLRASAGDLPGAREDWRRVARLDPDTTAARAARDNLARTEAAPAAATPPAGQAPKGN